MRVECFYYFHDYYEVKSNTSTSSRGNCKSLKVKLKRHFLDFCNMVAISDMLFIVGHVGIFGEVGRPNSMKPLPSPKFLKSKVFENKFF